MYTSDDTDNYYDDTDTCPHCQRLAAEYRASTAEQNDPAAAEVPF